MKVQVRVKESETGRIERIKYLLLECPTWRSKKVY